jgi:hypothetical protein
MLVLLILNNKYFAGFATAVLVLYYALILDLLVVTPYLPESAAGSSSWKPPKAAGQS